MPPDLLIRLKRRPDGSASLTCTRRDGTTTWQRQQGQLGWVFPPHDLTHYAVETTLGYRHAFYGLIADGWEIADFAKPWPRGPIPPEAVEVERIVGCFDAERLNMAHWSAAEFNAHATQAVAAHRMVKPAAPSLAPRLLTAAELTAVRACRADLLARWGALQPGETLELAFVRDR
jgi:hypothetical protein